MKIEIKHRCSDFESYRSERVKSLFNVESGCNFDRTFELPIEENPWQIGLVVGPSGSGKTSIGRAFPGGISDLSAGWPENVPIIDAISPDSGFNSVTGSLTCVGLASVPSWLRPFRVLSNGERFRAGLARLLANPPGQVVVDEFTSVVDRQVAKVGSRAFAKAWRRTPGRAVLLSCHYDIIDWLQPDWIFRTADGTFAWRERRPTPEIQLEIRRVDGSFWPLFEPHHYLKLPRPIAARYYVGFVAGEPVCHVATTPRANIGGMRACRLVVMPDWQGVGLGTRFLTEVARLTLMGDHGLEPGRIKAVYMNTSHPGLMASFRRGADWEQVSSHLYGSQKSACAKRINAARKGRPTPTIAIQSAGYGGHWRGIVGVKYTLKGV